MKLIPSVWLLLAGIFVACSAQQSPDTTPEGTADAPPKSIPLTVMPSETSGSVQGRLGDSTMFPYVYQGPGQSLIFEAYSMRFTLAHNSPLVALTNEVTPWVNKDNYNENNGLFATYVRNGIPLSLTNPYIQVQYINKKLPNCGTIDSVYRWLDQRLTGADIGEVVSPISTRTTAEKSRVAVCKEYKTFPQPNGRVAKFLAYAYIDYDENYLLALGLTTTQEADYKLTLPLFYQLAESFARY